MAQGEVPYPARIVPPAAPLPALNLLSTAIRNPIAAWPEAVYRDAMYRRRFAGRTILFLCEPEVIRKTLVEDADAFDKGEAMRRSLEPALGQGLLTAEGAHWRWQRRAAAPIFRHELLMAFVPQMIAAAERTRDRWLADPGAEIDVAHEMMLTTYDVIVDTMLSGRAGIDATKVEQAISDYLEPLGWVIAISLLRLPGQLPFPGKWRSRKACAFLRGEVLRVVSERRASGTVGHDLIGMLLKARDPETGRGMRDQELADNLLTFITAGHETTALALTWAFYLIDRYPDAAERIRREVQAATGGGPLGGHHVGALVYTRQVLQEAMRLYPPAAILTRTATRDIVISGEKVEAGGQVLVPIYALHRHRLLWGDPDAFDPNRFLPEASRLRHRYAYLPFGAGPRICIGMNFAMLEASVILAILVRDVRPTLRSGFSPEPKLRATLRPARGMPMRVEPVT